jgi:hypothetical protein
MIAETDVIGQRGLIIGDHPWSGCVGEIVRIERTLVGWGAVVRLNDKTNVPFGQETFIFEPEKNWKRIHSPRVSS